jgi:molybdate transport system regulatory protein
MNGEKDAATIRKIRLRSRQWIEDEHGKVLMGEGRARILELIEVTGSINKTAKELGMSYRGVWGKLKASEDALGMKFVHSEGKSGSRLTPEGKKFLKQYQIFKNRCIATENKLFDEIFHPEKPMAGQTT